jgi:hypothetical protein
MTASSLLLAVSSSCSDALNGSVFASLPLDRETTEWLKQRARRFLQVGKVYPEVYETYEFDSRLQWYDTGAETEYNDQADRNRLSRLTDDAPPLDDFRRTELDKLDAWEIPWVVVPTEELPGSGNLRAECEQLVMSRSGDSRDTIELRWICYINDTDVELCTFAISSEDIKNWTSELADEACDGQRVGS